MFWSQNFLNFGEQIHSFLRPLSRGINFRLAINLAACVKYRPAHLYIPNLDKLKYSFVLLVTDSIKR